MAESGFVKEAVAELQALSSRHRFAVLDGMRGVAALSVVLMHSFHGLGNVVNGQLAVDLFFILSGFVVAYSYDDRLRLPSGKWQFIVSRFIRLYPMLLIGALGGIALALIHNLINPLHAYAYRDIAKSGSLSLLVLPYLESDSINQHAFSFNPPIWSLFFEIVGNLIYVSISRFLSVRVLVAIIVFGLVSVVALGPLGGFDKVNFVGGFPRIIAGFFGGVLLFKLYQAGQLPKIGASIFVTSAVILAVFNFPIEIGGWLYLPAFLLLFIAVIGGINSSPAPTDGWCELLGLASYPVYLIHSLTLYVVTFIGKENGLHDILAALHLIAIPFMGYLVARYYETPARLFLSRILRPGRTAAA
jgi:peptidoglycan/LPS O-acetylase OafA/YrhL